LAPRSGSVCRRAKPVFRSAGNSYAFLDRGAGIDLETGSQKGGGVRRATGAALGLIALVLVLGALTSPATAQARQVFRLTLTGPDTDGSGTAIVKVKPRKGEVCYRIPVQRIGEPHEPAPGLGSAHIHFLAGGGIAVDLETQFIKLAADTFVAAGCVEADRALLRDIRRNPDAYYLNVHTTSGRVEPW
jgi:hypothetical protein